MVTTVLPAEDLLLVVAACLERSFGEKLFLRLQGSGPETLEPLKPGFPKFPAIRSSAYLHKTPNTDLTKSRLNTLHPKS